MEYAVAELAGPLGVHRDEVTRHLKNYGKYIGRTHIDLESAYTLCDQLGLHPLAVWPEMLDHIEVELRTCARLRCVEEFIPTNPKRIYCSQQCARSARNARWKKRRYHEDAEFRRKLLAENADYLASIDDAARQRRYRRRVSA